MCSNAASLYPHIKGEEEQLVFDEIIYEYHNYDLVTGLSWPDRTALLEANRVKINFNEKLSQVLIALKDAKSDKRHVFFEPAKNLPESDSLKEEKGVRRQQLSLRDY